MVDAQLQDFQALAQHFKQEQIKKFNDCVEAFGVGVEQIMNTTFDNIKEHCLEAITFTWSQHMQEFCQKREQIQEEKRWHLNRLVTGLGHPRERENLAGLEASASATNQAMNELIDTTKNSCIISFEKIATDFIGRLLFFSVLVNDVLSNWGVLSGMQACLTSAEPGTEKGVENLILPPLDFAAIPFASIRTKFQGTRLSLTVDLEIISHASEQNPLYHLLLSMRTHVLSAFTDKIRNLLTILDENVSFERNEEEKWKTAWESNILRMKRAF
ncbi:hypothetical protein HDU91_003738 [Kappamyces sp. JEL0680]|nr:hypothetical protein HDU91_003738 [Kappamyces sp. JEL0680]